MANLRDIRRRINSVKNTQKITRAMKMVAAAKLRRAQDAIVRMRPYAYRMRDIVNSLALRADSRLHPLLRRADGGRIELIVVTSDRGLCGGFNTNIVNAAMEYATAHFQNREVSLTLVGRRGIESLRRRRRLHIRKTYVDIMEGNSLRNAGRIIDELTEEFVKGELSEVHCVYNEFKSAISQRVVLERLLPFEPAHTGVLAIDYLYEPGPEALLDALLGQHLQVQMHRILHESAASEFGARMTAMDAATKNAGDVIDRLTLRYNRARQDTITREMIEIVSGTEAL
ncbi:MAG TPA: ATP synthase F1 subunit gamma [Candidatus Hydrogenedentes bacterium]|nr:ATP synthase F1 subunit gamma [Candidatus Hydrogenedentota bacterium]HOS02436.1 ATP synthase F1 subunit gamma [Candidatus Hydrogenedentota bacterium]